jgi:pimeloyl-ACP methyl ester carboxylesterase
MNVRDDVNAQLEDALSQNPDYELVIVGHSLGAAVATLAAADLRTKGHESAKLYAFASPRVANPTLAKFITAQNNNYRFTHQDDPVPKLPLIAMGYAHVSPEYWITSADNTTVTASDIDVVEGVLSLDGNSGTGVPLISDFHAHHWYFEKTDACLNNDLPFKR